MEWVYRVYRSRKNLCLSVGEPEPLGSTRLSYSGLSVSCQTALELSWPWFACSPGKTETDCNQISLFSHRMAVYLWRAGIGIWQPENETQTSTFILFYLFLFLSTLLSAFFISSKFSIKSPDETKLAFGIFFHSVVITAGEPPVEEARCWLCIHQKHIHKLQCNYQVHLQVRTKHRSICRPMLNCRSCIRIGAFTGGMWYAQQVWLTVDGRGRATAGYHMLNWWLMASFSRMD